MDWQINHRISNIKDLIYNHNIYSINCINCIDNHSSKMEKQRISTRSKRICWSRYRQTQIQKKRQITFLWKKNVTQSKINQWTSTWNWTREKKKSCYAICTKTFTTQERYSAPATKSISILFPFSSIL